LLPCIITNCILQKIFVFDWRIVMQSFKQIMQWAPLNGITDNGINRLMVSHLSYLPNSKLPFVSQIHGFVSFHSHESLLQKDLICTLRNESGFVSYCGSQILNVFKRFVLWICFVDWFSKDSTCFHESNKSLRILTNP
jgi:hypothetical protein